jgi:hypothetical protein
VEHAGSLSLIQGDWKYIEPSKGPRMNVNTNTELGNAPQPQLYHLKDDLGERSNVAAEYPERVKGMAALLRKIRTGPNRAGQGDPDPVTERLDGMPTAVAVTTAVRFVLDIERRCGNLEPVSVQPIMRSCFIK